MNLCKTYNEESIILTTLIERRNSTFLRIEDPLESLTSSTEVSDIVLSGTCIWSCFYSIAILLCILLKSLDCLILRNILRELVVSL